MGNIEQVISLLSAGAVTVERILSGAKAILPTKVRLPEWLWQLASLGVGVGIAYTIPDFPVLMAKNIFPVDTLLTTLVTGLLIGAGSNVIHAAVKLLGILRDAKERRI